MDHYQLLGIPRNCDRDTLHRAFRELSRKFHPDRHSETEREVIEAKYKAIVIAFNVLKDSKQREKYDKSLSFQQPETKPEHVDPVAAARKYYKIGLQKLKQKDYELAVEAFKRAVHYRQDPEFLFQKGLAESHVPKYRKESVNSLNKAIAKDPKNKKYYETLAKLLMEFGLKTRARMVVDRAVELFPEDEAIIVLAQEIAPEKYKKSGLFGFIFGKKRGG